mmetsp:Transcript_151744/g.486855  ORF Transcript_151744/g.486855 Transcript_151744/m.486855 type:complete len:478 (+) Transcript_151744:507-1940(+)
MSSYLTPPGGSPKKSSSIAESPPAPPAGSGPNNSSKVISSQFFLPPSSPSSGPSRSSKLNSRSRGTLPAPVPTSPSSSSRLSSSAARWPGRWPPLAGGSSTPGSSSNSSRVISSYFFAGFLGGGFAAALGGGFAGGSVGTGFFARAGGGAGGGDGSSSNSSKVISSYFFCFGLPPCLGGGCFCWGFEASTSALGVPAKSSESSNNSSKVMSSYLFLAGRAGGGGRGADRFGCRSVGGSSNSSSRVMSSYFFLAGRGCAGEVWVGEGCLSCCAFFFEAALGAGSGSANNSSSVISEPAMPPLPTRSSKAPPLSPCPDSAMASKGSAVGVVLRPSMSVSTAVSNSSRTASSISGYSHQRCLHSKLKLTSFVAPPQMSSAKPLKLSMLKTGMRNKTHSYLNFFRKKSNTFVSFSHGFRYSMNSTGLNFLIILCAPVSTSNSMPSASTLMKSSRASDNWSSNMTWYSSQRADGRSTSSLAL